MLARHLRRILPLAAVVLGALPVSAFADPPGNDAYLNSSTVNQRGTPLTQELVRDFKDTREATVQGDLFSPQGAGGGAETTQCRGANYGATVWYDFHPHADGTVRIDGRGYPAIISVYEFDPATSRITRPLECGDGVELFVNVKKGLSYTVQIGGVDAGAGPATGTLDVSFGYLSDTDGDGVSDALDRCPGQVGTRAAGGCPPELRATATLRADPTGNGILLRSLSLAAPSGARVTVRCRRGCAISQTRTARSARVLSFNRLRNRRLPAGARLEIFVTKPGSIGTYIRYTVTRGNVRRMRPDRCLKPGEMIPLRTCQERRLRGGEFGSREGT